MSSSDGFDKLRELLSPDASTDHPDVMYIEELVDAGFEITKAVFSWGSASVKTVPPTYIIVFSEPGGRRPERFDWSGELEGFLFKRGIRVATIEQEADRGAHILLRNIEMSDANWGAGYTDSVLQIVMGEFFNEVGAIQEMMSSVAVYPPDQSQSYNECKKYLEIALGGYANSLVIELKYSPEEARQIFYLAVVRMYDVRHNISIRKAIFPR